MKSVESLQFYRLCAYMYNKVQDKHRLLRSLRDPHGPRWTTGAHVSLPYEKNNEAADPGDFYDVFVGGSQ